MRSAKAAGSDFELRTAAGFAEALDDDRIERRTKNGANDRGDITGIRVWGQRFVVECKDQIATDISGWIREAHREAGNDDALCGIVVAKRRGTRDPLKQYVHMTVGDLIAILTGVPQAGRYE